jgi:hypothetical protein
VLFQRVLKFNEGEIYSIAGVKIIGGTNVGIQDKLSL